MKQAWIGLGGNVGDVRTAMVDALRHLERAGVTVADVSPLYETPPWGPVEQDRFLNACVAVLTEESPSDLLRHLHQAEKQLQRVREVRWGPRTIDLDLLAYEGFTSESAGLMVPHPRIAERAFVLVPLADVAPELLIDGRKVGDLAASAERGDMVRIASRWFEPFSAS